MTILWQTSTTNYFYGDFQAHRISLDGHWESCKKELSAGESLIEDWHLIGTLPPSALEQLKAILKTQFISLRVELPPMIVPDDFPLICQAELDGVVNQVSLFSNHDANSKRVIREIQDWIKANVVKI